MKVEIKDVETDVLSETGVVGTILQYPEYIANSDFLLPKHFKDRTLAGIYHIVRDMYAKGVEEIDGFTISNEIFGNKKMRNVYVEYGYKDVDSVLDYIDNLTLVARSSIEEYKILAKKVITGSFKRDSTKKLVEIANDISNSEEDINIINRRLQTTVSDFSSVYVCNDEIKTLGEKADKIMESIKAKQLLGNFGYPTIFPELNKYVSYTEEDVVCYQAGAKTGKSITLMNQAIVLAANGLPTFYIDTENSETLHFMRVLSFLTGISFHKIRDGGTTLAEDKLIMEKMEFIKTLNYVHIYDPVVDIDELYTKAKSLVVRNGLKVIVLDYLKNCTSSTDDYSMLGQMCMGFKNMCGELRLAGITAAQSNRGGDIQGSIKITQNVSTMVKLARKTKEEIVNEGRECGNVKMCVTHNRNGDFHLEGEWINVQADGDICTMREADIPIPVEEDPFE